jgi:undecaprenyl pyrophosphate phosphatase UppP
MLPVTMAITNATTAIERAMRMLVSNPDLAVKGFAIMVVQFVVDVIFSYFAVRALKRILALIDLTLLLSYITAVVSPIPIDMGALL